jgi:hypothetical protein
MAFPKVPIPVQLSPSTYMLLMNLIELCVNYDPASDDLTLHPNVQPALDTLYDALINAANAAGRNPTQSRGALVKLQQDGLNEAEFINKNARSQVTLPC